MLEDVFAHTNSGLCSPPIDSDWLISKAGKALLLATDATCKVVSHRKWSFASAVTVAVPLELVSLVQVVVLVVP